MKMFDINGEIVKVDVRPSTYPLRGVSKSKLQSLCGQFLQDKFPREPILEEFTIPGSRMSVDFFLPQIKLCVEINGIQHSQHSNFFHGDRNTSTKFAKQKMRDSQKSYWCELNGFKLVNIETEEDFKCLTSEHN